MIQRVITGTHVPAKMWLDKVEDTCLEQIVNLASLPFVFKHIAIMPDAHTGMGMPIGGVMATKGVVVPNAVGVDIGCGMCAMKTDLKADQLSRHDLGNIMELIRRTIPLGFAHRAVPVDERLLPDIDLASLPFLKTKKEAILREIGTLGGGNHFIEIQRDARTADVWVMLHSGSRHVGLTVAKHYNRMAELWCEKWYAETLPGLAFLPIEDQTGRDYMREMAYCVELARVNRLTMMAFIREAFAKVRPGVTFGEVINVPHNYAAWEQHFGHNVIVHRKGATRARRGDIGIIPGSMGTKSFIVEGLGNPDAFMSCSHGAGRRMSRSQAFKRLSLDHECAAMNARGIIHNMSQRGLDEAPSAYKDIDRVMALESDLVRPVVELLPMAVVKGE